METINNSAQRKTQKKNITHLYNKIRTFQGFFLRYRFVQIARKITDFANFHLSFKLNNEYGHGK